MKTMSMLCLATSVTLFGSACGGEEEEERHEVSTSELSGTVAGEPFTVEGGYAEDKFGDGELWVELFSEPLEDPCNTFTYPTGPSIIISTTPEEKDVDLSLQNNITFSYQEGDTSANDVSTDGRLIIESVGDTLVGRLYATFGDHEVDGRFEVEVCPADEQ